MLVPFLLTSLLNALNAIQRLGAFLDQDESLDVEIDGSDPGEVVLNDNVFLLAGVAKRMKEDEKNTDEGGAHSDSWRSVSDDGERRRRRVDHSSKEETDEENKARVEKEQKRLDEESGEGRKSSKILASRTVWHVERFHQHRTGKFNHDYRPCWMR